MKTIITEEMRFRYKVVKYAIKHNNNTKAARRYHTSRQQVQRWRKKFDGTIQSLAKKSRRPHSHPNEHTQEELDLKCVQIDIKFVPKECIGFASNHSRYYQITAIDEYTRKPYAELVSENSTYTTSEFLKRLEEKMGFKIKVVQTDNGSEFVNDSDKTTKKSRFQNQLKRMGIEHKRTRPYSPWQNGIVERSHRIDNEFFYSKRRFKSFEEMEKAFKRYHNRYNNIARKILGFKTPNEVVEEYFSKDAA